MKANEIFIKEGVYDPHIFKAVFMAGAPGAGKSTVANLLFQHTGLKSLNVDTFWQLYKAYDKQGDYDKFWDLYKKQEQNYLNGRLGLLIDGTARNPEKMAQVKARLEQLGYDCAMIFVNTTLETSIARTVKRADDPGKDQGRTIDSEFVANSWQQVQNGLGQLQSMFGRNFYIVDNNEGKPRVDYVEKELRNWLTQAPKNSVALDWIKQQKEIKANKMNEAEAKLKPGQTREIKIELGKAAGKVKSIAALMQKVESLEATQLMTGGAVGSGKHISSPMSKNLKKQFEDFKQSLQQEINDQKAKIAELKKLEVEKYRSSLGPFAAKLAKECGTAIAAYKSANAILFRGLSSSKNNPRPKAFIGRSWTERKVRDSNPGGQIFYDAALQMLGIKALRSNSIFTTSDAMQAGEYGQLYIIIPKNGFAFSWSKIAEDFTIEEGDMDMILNLKLIDKLENEVENGLEKQGQEGIDATFLELLTYEPDGFKQVVNYLKQIKHPIAQKLKPSDLVDIKTFKKRIQPDATSLTAAIKSGNEVCISGEYYALEANAFQYLLPLLGIEANNI